MIKFTTTLIFVVTVVNFVLFSPQSNARADSINIAVAGPMTGEYAAFGEDMEQGAEKAVHDINAKGGVIGKNLTLSIGDDQCDPKQAVAVANVFVSKGVVFVAGHFCSGSSIPASSVYHDEGILQMTPASTNPKLTDDAAAKGWDTVFRTCGRDDQQASFAGAWIAEHYKGKNVAIIDDKSTYGKGLADLVRAALNMAGMKEALDEEISVGEKDYSTVVEELKRTNIDVIYFGGYHPEAALIVKQSREQGLNAQLISGDSLNTQEFANLAGDAANGVMFTNDNMGYDVRTYAAIQAYADAVAQANTTDPEKVAAALRSHPWETIMGKISFDSKGDLTTSTYVWYVFTSTGPEEASGGEGCGPKQCKKDGVCKLCSQ
jgi:branched-chain amino acid transport system substrate-binding protein